MKRRDDFSKATKTLLAGRAAFSCTVPSCRRVTIGAANGHHGIINVGEAAHITAALPGGPRYNPDMTPEERRSADNGIWVCRDHHAVIDQDDPAYTVDLLRAWKAQRDKETADGVFLGAISEAMRAAADPRPVRAPTRIEVPALLGRLLVAADTDKIPPTQRSGCVGEAVVWGRLCDGAYAKRPHLMAPLLAAYLAWLCSLTDLAAQRKLPIFWVDGRSGDGKSVLLLQLAREILDFDPDAPVYLASNPDSVSEIIDLLADGGAQERQILLFVDDLHRTIDLDTLNDAILLHSGRETRNIAIITCGPTPERSAFQKRIKGVSVENWSVPAITSHDTNVFSEWFDLPLSSDVSNNPLLVEVLFVANVGQPIPEFASHFKGRLERFGVFEKTQIIVALNSLDVGAPISLLGLQTERDAIARLAREDQLHFELTEERGEAQVRLTHRAIAWRLFDEWSTDALLDVSSQTRFARVIASLLCLQRWPYGFYRTLVGLLPQKARELFSTCEPLGSAAEFEFWHELFANVPIESHGAATAAEAYLQHLRESSDLGSDSESIRYAGRVVSSASATLVRRARIAALLAVLERAGRIQNEDWRAMAEQLCLEDSSLGRTWGAARMLISWAGSGPRFAEAWIAVHSPALRCRPFLIAALAEFGASEALREAATRWVKVNWHHPRTVEVLCTLIGGATEVREADLPLKWIEEHPEEVSTSDLLQLLIRAEPQNPVFRDRATKWLARNPVHPGAIVLIIRLMSISDARGLRDLKPAIHAILTDNPAVSSLGALLPSILRRYGGTFRDSAAAWLKANEDYTGARDVISSLARLSVRADELHSALRWCDRNRARTDISTTLCTILNSRAANDEIRQEIARLCLEEISNRNMFQPIATLVNVSGADLRSRELAEGWISRHWYSKGTMQLLSTLAKMYPEDDDIYELARAAAETRATQRETGHLVSTMVRVRPSDHNACELARVWIAANWDSAEAAQSISTLLSADRGPDIEELAVRWIEENPHRRYAQHQLLASVIGTRSEYPSWIDYSLRWLSPEKDTGDPQYVYETLCAVYYNREDVASIIRRYVRSHHNSVPARQVVIDTWLSAPDAGPAIKTLVSVFREQDRTSPEGMELHGLLIRASAKHWPVMQQLASTERSLSGDICYLVGRGLPAVRVDYSDVAESLSIWPREHLCYILAGLIQSRCASALFAQAVYLWLAENWRRRGYGVVLDAVEARMRREVTFALRIPRQAYRDLGSPRRSSRLKQSRRTT